MPLKKSKLEHELKSSPANLELNMKFHSLDHAEQAEILNRCETVAEALRIIAEKSVAIDYALEEYQSLVTPSGTASGALRNKQLFDDLSSFEETDIQEFIACVRNSVKGFCGKPMTAELLNRSIRQMSVRGRSPLQCMVYATKGSEKVFYANEEMVDIWAEVIAAYVSDHPEEVHQMNHMLRNWKMWPKQTALVILAGAKLRENELNEEFFTLLDNTIREEYEESKDDEIRFAVMQCMLRRMKKENYTCVFRILRSVNFTEKAYKRYFIALEDMTSLATTEQLELLYQAYQGVTTRGFGDYGLKKCNWIEGLFKQGKETDIIEFINHAPASRRAEVIEAVRLVLESHSQRSEFFRHLKELTAFRDEVQEQIQRKLLSESFSPNLLRDFCFALLNTGKKKGIRMLHQLLSHSDRPKKEHLVFLYVLANYQTESIPAFVEMLLSYPSGNRKEEEEARLLIPAVKTFVWPERKGQVSGALYLELKRIVTKHGYNSPNFVTALKNLSYFMNANDTDGLYPPEIDEILFDFLGYDQKTDTFDKSRCNPANTKTAFILLGTVMKKQNYQKRYMHFMQSLFNYFNTAGTYTNLCAEIQSLVIRMTGEGLPAVV